MDFNQCMFTGQASWFKEKKLGPSFGAITVKVDLPKFEFYRQLNDDHELVSIQKPILWLDIATSYDRGRLQDKEREFLSSLEKRPYIFCRDAKIKNWTPKTKDGEVPQTRFTLSTYANKVSTRETPYKPFNHALFSGKVMSNDYNGRILLESSYRNVKTNTYETRKIPILNPAKNDPSIVNNKVVIIGQICATRPDNTDGLYVVSNDLVRY